MDHIYNIIDNLEKENSDLMKVIIIGYTINGTPLKVVQINPEQNNNSNFGIWIDGGTHAREWISISSILYILNEIIHNREFLSINMKMTQFFIMPVLNPDGYRHSQNKERFWRKNRSKTFQKNCIGVDLNRNWDFQWNETITIENPCSETYKGLSPNSELEIKSVATFLQNNLKNIKGFVTFHSFGQKIIYPWAYNKSNVDDQFTLNNIGKLISQEILKKTLNIYTTGSASLLLGRTQGKSKRYNSLTLI
ncbi:carboxypeptidase B2-like [Daktulosphaira vitifoliae]|uniref:carboxypeptidase B2-like n=1 Tax=Daktulosphaira vitifoliae TaxID=58002 RepID=UPI0021AAAC2F|nr:carboxypeptidase B2-like [Daktulosphaira vitifoliae]